MGRAKKKAKPLPHYTPEEIQQAWDEYFAIQLTPEQKAAARAELQKDVERAREDGVYERLLEIVGKVQWSIPFEELRDKDDD